MWMVDILTGSVYNPQIHYIPICFYVLQETGKRSANIFIKSFKMIPILLKGTRIAYALDFPPCIPFTHRCVSIPRKYQQSCDFYFQAC